MLFRSLALAWARPGLARVWVHTCSLDHPRALDFYRKSGFVPYKMAIEVTPDPRLTGLLSRAAAAHSPIIDPI